MKNKRKKITASEKKEKLFNYLIFQYQNDINVINYKKSLLDKKQLKRLKKLMKETLVKDIINDIPDSFKTALNEYKND